MTRQLFVTVTLLAAVSVAPAWATTIHVPADQPTIQAGIDAASAGDTVLVACGTYYEHDIVMSSGVCLMSETGLADCVTVDAQGSGRVFYCDGVDSLAVISGFTVTGGFAYEGAGVYCARSSLGISSVGFLANSSDANGGGIYCREQSSLTLTDCVFRDNTAGSSGGGGVWCYGDCVLAMVDCLFEENVAGSNGGGVYCAWSSFSLHGCDFIGNTAHYSAGGMDAQHCLSSVLDECSFVGNVSDHDAGGLKYNHSTLELTDCLFSGNSCVWSGGGLFSDWTSSTVITSSAFLDNTALASGGAIYNSLSDVELVSVTFSGNSCGQLGGGVFCRDHGNVVLSDSVLAFSTAGRAVYCDDTSSASASCCDVYGNAGGDWVGCIADQYGINGNISADPMFCDPDNGNFMLDSMSPCAPDNNDCGVLIGAYPVGCGASPVEATRWGRVKATYR